MSLNQACSRILLLLILIVMGGCSQASKEEPDDSNIDETRTFDVKVAFVGDATIAQIMEKQWKSYGHSIELKVLTEDQISDRDGAKLLDYDVVIFPPYLIGTLVSQECLDPVSTDQLNSRELRPADILRSHRQDLVSYGGTNWGVSLGGPTFTLIYREDILKQLNLPVPQTWAQYEQVALKLAEQQGKLKNNAGELLPTTVLEPLARHHGNFINHNNFHTYKFFFANFILMRHSVERNL